jgi:hypothetical protein
VGVRLGGADESGQFSSAAQCPVELLDRYLTGSNGAMQRLEVFLAVEPEVDNRRSAVGPNVQENRIEQDLGDRPNSTIRIHHWNIITSISRDLTLTIPR